MSWGLWERQRDLLRLLTLGTTHRKAIRPRSTASVQQRSRSAERWKVVIVFDWTAGSDFLSQHTCPFRRSGAIGPALVGQHSHPILRAFVAVFPAARGFLRAATAVLFALPAASTGDRNSNLGCFAVRWWPWCSGWMRAASSSVRS